MSIKHMQSDKVFVARAASVTDLGRLLPLKI
jgi:hypothetical protein